MLNLVPFGLLAVSVFPAYFHHYGYGEFAQFSPSECVVFEEITEPPHHHRYPYKRHRYKRKARQKQPTKV